MYTYVKYWCLGIYYLSFIECLLWANHWQTHMHTVRITSDPHSNFTSKWGYEPPQDTRTAQLEGGTGPCAWGLWRTQSWPLLLEMPVTAAFTFSPNATGPLRLSRWGQGFSIASTAGNSTCTSLIFDQPLRGSGHPKDSGFGGRASPGPQTHLFRTSELGGETEETRPQNLWGWGKLSCGQMCAFPVSSLHWPLTLLSHQPIWRSLQWLSNWLLFLGYYGVLGYHLPCLCYLLLSVLKPTTQP